MEFYADDGSALEVTIDDATASSFEFKVPARGMKRVATSGTSDPVETGWAQLTATLPVGAQVLFEIEVSGKLVTQAAVESIGPIDVVDVFVDRAAGTNTGIAMANLSISNSVLVRITLLDETGQVVGSTDVTIAARGHLAQFIHELIADLGDVRGTASVNASGPITVVTLQQTGVVIGTLPPVIRSPVENPPEF